MPYHQEVKVKRETVAPFMTCPICHKLFREPTTVMECLHTFCRKCIYKTLSEEGIDSCPICNIYLGCTAREKLRPDHKLQDLRAKIFPRKTPPAEAPAALPAITTPKASTHGGRTQKRRSKSAATKASKGSNFTMEKAAKNATDLLERSGSPEMLNKSPQHDKQETHRMERDFGELRIGAADAGSSRPERKSFPIWFSLVASHEHNGGAPPLPQISANYLRIKDGTMAVSYIQKYLQKKLNLPSETQVDIKLMGQTVDPTLTLNNVMDLWLETKRGETVSATAGSSGKEFVMVLEYARRLT